MLYDIRTQPDTVGEGSESEGSGTAFTGVVGHTHAAGIDSDIGRKGQFTEMLLMDTYGYRCGYAINAAAPAITPQMLYCSCV